MSRPAREPRSALVALPEDLLSRLLSRRSILDEGANADDEVDAALAYRADIAVGEVAKALVETGRTLSHLHLLVDALEQIGVPPRLRGRRGHDRARAQRSCRRGSEVDEMRESRGHPSSGSTAIGYVRVSTEDQAQGGVSLEAHRRRIEAY